jgi:hypothetical protein
MGTDGKFYLRHFGSTMFVDMGRCHGVGRGFVKSKEAVNHL